MTAEPSKEEITANLVSSAATAAATAVMEAAKAAAQVIAAEHGTTMVQIAVLQRDVTALKDQQGIFEASVNRRMDSWTGTLKEIYAKLDDIALGRPTWAISLMMGGMFSLCVGLIVFIVTRR